MKAIELQTIQVDAKAIQTVDAKTVRKNDAKAFRAVDSKALHIAKKNVKEKLKNFGQMFWTIAFPIMMLIVYKLAFKDDDGSYIINGLTVFSMEFPGIVVYTIGISTMTSAVMFAMSKKDGTLQFIDTMPVSRGNVFLGAVLSETIFMNIQLVIVFVFGYALGAHFELAMLPLGYGIAMIFGVGAIGLGLIIASLLKSPEAANAFGMLTHMIFMFVSGSFFPMDHAGVFFTPHYWVKQVFLQLTVVGDSFSDLLYSCSIITPLSETTIFPIWVGLIIILAFTTAFIALGIKIFQRKTSL
ncbi:MAG: daunorubicin resistance ABC transporter inner membrane subunit B [Promethearchaeota archaeon CR_4]|nr:MAG: daunorubicin resistance ABC transporter inner membrane subunit B [Candidatus Lokiarchaeota archaeon CR_4]